MKNFFRLTGAFVIATAASAVPQRVIGQTDVHVRNDCRLASQILRSGHPAPHREWAWSVIDSCSDSAATVLADVWSDPPENELAQLWGVSHRLRDARLTRAVLNTLRDPSRSRAARITAARVLATHASPKVVVLSSNLAAIIGDSVHVAYISVDHSDVRQGAVPVTPALAGEIRDALSSIGQEDFDPEVRSVARAVARQIQMHVRT